jgi:hypothetical protein
MRNTVAKRLRKAALNEMLHDNVPKRDLVMGPNSVINSPQSIRALYLQLKASWKNLVTAAPALVPTRLRKPSSFHRPQNLRAGPALIASPLKHILGLFPGSNRPDGSYELNPTSALAIAWAKSGQGHKVSALARRFV